MKEEQEKLVENFGDGKVGELRSYVWDLMEKPWTSDAAQWYAVLSMMVVVISTITFVFSTLESENEEESHPIVLLAVEIIGLRARFCFGISIAYNSDITCVVIFSLEYGVRFLCAPQRVSFFKDPMNLGFKLFIQILRSNINFSVDFFALLPFYVSLVLEELEDYQIIGKAGKIIRLMRVQNIKSLSRTFF